MPPLAMNFFVGAVGLCLLGYILYRYVLPRLTFGPRDEAQTSQANRESDIYRGFFDPIPAVRSAKETEEQTADPTPQSDPGPLVTVNTYSDAESAHLARVTLEQEGIPVFVADDGLVGVYWLYADAVGGVKVQVPEDYAQSAFEILCESESAAPEKEPPDTTPDTSQHEPLPTEPDAPRCLVCGSTELYPVPWRRGLFFILYLILGLALPVATRRYQCDQCGAAYRDRPEPQPSST